VHQAPEPALTDTLGQRVDRDQPPGVRTLLGIRREDLEIRMSQLPAVAVTLHRPTDNHPLAATHGLQNVALVEPEAEQHTAAITDGDGLQATAATGAPFAGGQHLAGHRNLLSILQTVEGRGLAPIEIAPRIVGQQIAHADHAEARQGADAHRADGVEKLNRGVQRQ